MPTFNSFLEGFHFNQNLFQVALNKSHLFSLLFFLPYDNILEEEFCPRAPQN